MTDLSTDPQAAAPAFDAERRATELAILDSLRAVVDPEIGMNVVELALIKQIILGPNETEIKMILTTPFCPYAGSMIAQVKEQTETVVDPEIGMNVVELALIKQIILGPEQTEVKMILTTPFCPYAGAMIQQVKEQVESVVDNDVKITLLAERWDPRDAGLVW